ncbi:hypothetical protein KKQ10_03460 [Pseudomonas sp. MG-9]|uniref:Uncharacterized protein n=1 Tax=Pseudomonas serboccidentalis TaxID=2964670 RepID=A0ABY7Z8B6_9PSED|nr:MULTISPECIES: hypothetical protein [Pseudomonas]MBT9263917.1 hypothetical protein [Pseudomonas sp. MG-9]WDR35829.1 hypothetical protein NN484_25610 [Pseudomonas serboccidentalis]
MKKLNNQSPPPVIPDALANIPGGQENLIPTKILESPLRVLIPDFTRGNMFPGIQGYVELNLSGIPVRETRFPFTTPIDPSTFPIMVHIPVGPITNEGTYEVDYTVNLGGNVELSESNYFTVDRTAPNDGEPGQAPKFPPEIIRQGITQDYLDTNNDEVLITISHYKGQRLGETIPFYYGSFDADPVSTTKVKDADSDTIVRLSGNTIREKGNGNKIAYYRLKSRAGIQGPSSLSLFIKVDLS